MNFFDFHVHSHFSKDSNMVPENLVRVAKKKGLRGVAITDHNTITGGVKAKKTCGSHFFVVVGAEIRTNAYEIIGLFLTEEVSSTDPFAVIDEIRDQGGITVLPHPFRSFFPPHSRRRQGIPMDILKKIDVIEAFNARSSVKANQQALALASTLRKPMIAGSDAHWYRELGRGKTLVAPFTNEEDLRRNLLAGRTRIEDARNTFPQSMPFLVLSTLYGRIGRLSQRSRVRSRRQRPATKT
jgi:predicted metal-dependent phosphoesterase TrpH